MQFKDVYVECCIAAHGIPAGRECEPRPDVVLIADDIPSGPMVLSSLARRPSATRDFATT